MKLHVIMRDTHDNTKLICSMVSVIGAKKLHKALLRSFIFIDKENIRDS